MSKRLQFFFYIIQSLFQYSCSIKLVQNRTLFSGSLIEHFLISFINQANHCLSTKITKTVAEIYNQIEILKTTAHEN